MEGVAHPCSSEHAEDGEHVHNQALPVIHAFPHRHTKLIHFVRHGEGYHNGVTYLQAHPTRLSWRCQVKEWSA